MKKRIAAIAALMLAVVVVGGVLALIAGGWGDSRPEILLLLVAAAGTWYGVQLRGLGRMIGFAVAALGLAGTIALLVSSGHAVPLGAVTAAMLGLVATARIAFRTMAPLPAADAPKHPVLIFDPSSGGGKAVKLNLAEEARKRGITPIELHSGEDIEKVVATAVADGADGLAMAGGDDLQAVVAASAASHDLPYACVATGTKNQFAIDLGVDRDDIVGGLDAFVDGGERVVDLAEVNGRVFVNSVSLGRDRKAVQRSEQRSAELGAMVDASPERGGPPANGTVLQWKDAKGHEWKSRASILVSNNPRRINRAVAFGTRPRLDEGKLGITVHRSGGRGLLSGWRQFTAPTFEVEANTPVSASLDGNAIVLESPIRFRAKHDALRVRIAKGQPGRSPSAGTPGGWGEAVTSLARIAAGRE